MSKLPLNATNSSSFEELHIFLIERECVNNDCEVEVEAEAEGEAEPSH